MPEQHQPEQHQPERRLTDRAFWMSLALLVVVAVMSLLPTAWLGPRWLDLPVYQNLLVLGVTATLSVLFFGVMQGSSAIVRFEKWGFFFSLTGAAACAFVFWKAVVPAIDPTASLAVQLTNPAGQSVRDPNGIAVTVRQETANQTKATDEDRLYFPLLAKGDALDLVVEGSLWELVGAEGGGGCQEQGRGEANVVFEPGCTYVKMELVPTPIDLKRFETQLLADRFTTTLRQLLQRQLYTGLQDWVAHRDSGRNVRIDLRSLPSGLHEERFEVGGISTRPIGLCVVLDHIQQAFSETFAESPVRVGLDSTTVRVVLDSDVSESWRDDCADV
jgi:hypothetical protein